MTITFDLDPADEKKILERAARSGQDVTAYIHRFIERDLRGVDEALAPFRRQVEESGMSDEELRAFFEEVREDAWREKQGTPSQAS
jgi:hypothetical protein